jgi:uncharacterized membrane protein YhaH (DUF805 family)
MEAIDYYKDVLFEKYADFHGRARRAEFWNFYLVHLLFLIGMAMIGPRINFRLYFISLVFYTIATIIPTFAVTVRRLHDTERSGWWYFISFIPIIGTIILIVFLATEGTYGPNYYGEDPKEEDFDDLDMAA